MSFLSLMMTKICFVLLLVLLASFAIEEPFRKKKEKETDYYKSASASTLQTASAGSSPSNFLRRLRHQHRQQQQQLHRHKCPNIISRSQWSTVPVVTQCDSSGKINYLIVPIPYVIIHHTVTPECNSRETCTKRVDSIRGYHMDQLDWYDIGYSFLIGGDGNVYEGRGWIREGAHMQGYNKKAVGISFIGNFENKNASQKMLDAAHQLINCGKSQGIIRNNVRVLGARQLSRRASPGKDLYVQIQNWPEWSSEP